MIYDYKSDELTQETYVTCIIPLVDDIIDEYSTLRRYENLSIYTSPYIAREMLAKLFEKTNDLWVSEESDGVSLHRDNDVVITIAYDGMVFVENAKENGVIKSNEDSCLTYFYDGLNKKDLDVLEENAESILVFGFEGDDCEGCTDGDNMLTTTNESHYYVNGKKVSKQVWEKEQKIINDTIEAFRRDFWDNWFI